MLDLCIYICNEPWAAHWPPTFTQAEVLIPLLAFPSMKQPPTSSPSPRSPSTGVRLPPTQHLLPMTHAGQDRSPSGQDTGSWAGQETWSRTRGLGGTKSGVLGRTGVTGKTPGVPGGTRGLRKGRVTGETVSGKDGPARLSTTTHNKTASGCLMHTPQVQTTIPLAPTGASWVPKRRGQG
jgi:hypothetical protein